MKAHCECRTLFSYKNTDRKRGFGFMLIVDDIVSYFMGSGIEKLERVYGKYQLNKYISSIKEDIINNINRKYETEPFFNSFSNFYEGNKITERMLNRIFNVDDEESVGKMISSLTESFINQYKMYAPHETRINEILNGIYQSIFKGISASGVLSETEMNRLLVAKYGRKQLDSISELKELTKSVKSDIGQLKESVKEILDSDKVSALSNGFRVLSETDESTLDNSEYAEKIKYVEKNIQEKYKFREAVDAYKNLLTDLFEMQCSDEVLFANIYINIALCYANLRNYEEAEKNIKLAEKHIKDNNSKIYYVKGYISWKEGKQRNHEKAKEELLKALEINPKYVSAKLLLCIVEAALKNDIEQTIQKLKELEQEAPADRLGDVLQAYGLVYRLHAQFEKAEEYVLRADEVEEDIANTVNLGVIYYSWATKNNVHDRRQLRINVDYPKMFKALYYLEKVMCDTSEVGILYKQDVMEIYISACAICGAYDLIDEIEKVDINSLDYEAARTLIFHRIRKGDKEAAELLQKEDREFHDLLNIVEAQEQNSLDLIMTQIGQVPESELYRYYNLGLQVALNVQDIEKYKLLRGEVKSKKIDCPYMDLYDAEYNAMIGQDEKAKAFFDQHIFETHDDYILIPAIKFYQDRGCVLELSKLYEEILKNLHDRKFTCNDVEGLVGDIFNFFIERDFKKALELYEILDSDIIGKETYNGIKYNLFGKIMDVKKILEANKELQKSNQSIKLRMEELILLKYDMQFMEATEKAVQLLNSGGLSDQQRITLLELMSECALFSGDLNKSVEYITQAKDLGKELVYDPVHQLYMSRLLRCGNHEGLKYGMEFQQTHPIITDWIRPITITKTSDDKSLDGEFADFIKEQSEQLQSKIDFYNSNTISFYQFQRIVNSDMLNILTYPENYGTRILIGTGINEEIQNQVEQIGDSVVVDAFTLIFLEKHQISAILDLFKTVYVTYSSIEEIEKLYLKYDDQVIVEVLKKIKEDLRFEKAPNYADYNEEESIYHPKSFLDALELAKCKECKFLCFDTRASLFFVDGKKYMLEIIPVIQKMKDTRNDNLAAKMIYNLIDKKLTFVNFDAKDILYALSQTGEQAERKLSAFMKINRHCDIDSFCSVYLHTIRILHLSRDEKTIVFLEMMLQMLDKIYNRARMEKWRYEQHEDKECITNYYLYLRFVITLIVGLFHVFANDEKMLSRLFEWKYKFISIRFLNTIYEECKGNDHFSKDVINKLTNII